MWIMNINRSENDFQKYLSKDFFYLDINKIKMFILEERLIHQIYCHFLMKQMDFYNN